MIKQLTDPFKNWQKVCAGEDYSHPDFNEAVLSVLSSLPSYHRKQWEFVVIYLNLMQCGKLNEGSVGASFGAGKEPLIYIITEFVQSFVATDLYIYNTGWSTAKVEKGATCLDFVLEGAPEGFSKEKLDVKEMDMRQLEMEDKSLDFCYSSCAFEHIGVHEDFVRHLSEVKRVLKDDGVYVMTTEHLFMHDTMPIKGNYKFCIKDLLAIFKDADFYPNKEFDNSLAFSQLNKPRPEINALAGISNELLNLFPGLIFRKRGMPYTSSCFVFKKSNKGTEFSQTAPENTALEAFFANNLTRSITATYQNYCILDPFARLRNDVKSDMSDHLDYLVEKHDDFFETVKLEKGNFIFTDFICFDDFTFKFVININLFNAQKLKFKLIEMNQLNNERSVIDTQIHEFVGDQVVSFVAQAKIDKVYALAVNTVGAKEVALKSAEVKVKIT